MDREQVRVAILAGTFESQPEVFAYLFDMARAQGVTVELDEIDVICKTDPEPRLKHYFAGPVTDKIIDLMALHTTVVLGFPGSGLEALRGSDRLSPLGNFRGTRPRPRI